MNTTLWIVQGLLTFVFLMAGFMKVSRSKDQLASQMAWVEDFSQSQIRMIGFTEILGALGLVLPMITGILPTLTPIAAIGFVLLMLGATTTHLRRGENPMAMMTIALALMAAFVAYGRF